MIWWCWFVASMTGFGIIEGLALTDRRVGTTLSAGWWGMRTHLVTRLVFFPPLAWVIWHLLLPWDRGTGGWDDAAAVATGVALAVVTKYRPRVGE